MSSDNGDPLEDTIYTAYLDDSLTLCANGKWHHEGRLISNANLSAYFHRAIFWDKTANRYWLKVGKGKASFKVEDTAQFVKEATLTKNEIKIKLFSGMEMAVKEKDFKLGAEGKLYVELPSGERATVLRSAYQYLANSLMEGKITFEDI